MTKLNTPKVTPASDWQKRAKGEIKQLPSGVSIRVARPSLFALARSGHIPNPLAAEVIKYFAISDDQPPKDEADHIRQYQENAAAYVNIAAATVTEPKIVTALAPDYDAGEIAPEDLSTADLIAIYNYVVNGVEIELTTDAGFQPESTDQS